MLNNINISRYCNINSPIHNITALIKIICTLLFSILTFISYDLKMNILITILLLIILLLSNIPIKKYLISIWSLKGFLIFIFLINLLLGNNLYITIITILRIIYVMLYSMMLLGTTTLKDLIIGLEQFFSPLKIFNIPVSKIAFSISLALHFIPELLCKGNNILKSLSNRGINYSQSNIKEKITILKIIIFPMFILSIKKADKLAETLEIRLFDVNSKIAYKNHYKLYEIFILLVHLALLFLIVKETYL